MHTTVLLAGGRSTRMGRDKATLPWEGGSLWEHQAETLAATKPARTLYSLSTEQALPVPGEDVVRDVHTGIGPAGGLSAALEVAETPLLLVLAVDLPGVESTYLEKLLSLARDGCGVVPRSQGYFEPLVAIYPATFLPMLQASIAREEFGMQKMIRAAQGEGLIRVVDTKESEEVFFRNLNSPDDL